jgi:hypothetical protein
VLARLAADENFDARILAGLRARLPLFHLVTVEQANLRAATDPAVLEWAAREGRVLLTHDERTMPGHAYDRMDAELPMPGVILVPDRMPIGPAIDDLALIVQVMEPGELAARGIVRLPL